MATTTIEVYTDERDRLKYYKSVFYCNNMPDLVRELMNKMGLASIEDIKRLQQLKGETVEKE